MKQTEGISKAYRGDLSVVFRRIAIDRLEQDHKSGRLGPIVSEFVRRKGSRQEINEQVKQFLNGMEIGMAYSFALLASGQMDLAILRKGG